jgi:hypothetical protein
MSIEPHCPPFSPFMSEFSTQCQADAYIGVWLQVNLLRAEEEAVDQPKIPCDLAVGEIGNLLSVVHAREVLSK